jgi:biuret amidohydrolase
MKQLLIIDLINEFIDPTGKLSAKGYTSFATVYDSISQINNLISKFTTSGDQIIFCNLGFESDYSDLNPRSQLLGGAKAHQILQKNTWSTSIPNYITVPADAIVMTKSTISAYSSTMHLLNSDNDIYLIGLSTDLGVLATALDLHDNGFTVNVVADCCIAPNKIEHEGALVILNKFCTLS